MKHPRATAARASTHQPTPSENGISVRTAARTARSAARAVAAGLAALTLFSAPAAAASSFDIARQLVNDPSKDAKLAVLFSQNDARPNIKQISQTLKMNGLLHYSYDTAQPQQINFAARSHASIMLKVISSAFEQIGISYFLPSAYEKNGSEIELGFMVNSKTVVDPGALYLVLANMGVSVEDLRREGKDFYYVLDFSQAKVSTQLYLESGSSTAMKKPMEDYFIALSPNLKTLKLTPNQSDIWYPKVLFLDKNLNLITSHLQDVRTKNLDLAVPANSKFAIIGDQFSLENIKHGLEIAGE